MSTTATRRISAGIAAAIVLTVPALTAAPASATYFLPDTSVDVCKNVHGVQTIWDLKAGTWRFKHRTPAQHDCVKTR